MTFSIRLKGDLEERLNRLALINERSKAFFVNKSLTAGLSIDQLEQIYLQTPNDLDTKAKNVEQESGEGTDQGQLSLV